MSTCLVGVLWKPIDVLSTIYKVCVMLWCTLCEHKDRIVIVPHDLIFMIHCLVFSTHLEDEGS